MLQIWFLALSVAWVGGLSVTGFAQEPLTPTRFSTPPVLDGQVDEVWSSVSPVELVGHVPQLGGRPTEKTEVRMAYDDQYLYLLAMMHDSQPEGIIARSLRRDDSDSANDGFGFTIDSYGDRQTGVSFATTPAGIRIDMAVSNNAQGMNGVSRNWNAFWDVEVSRAPHGWAAEFRIPFSTLRFVPSEEVRMGILLWRNLPRLQETSTFPAVDPKHGPHSLFRVSEAHPFVLRGVRPEKPVYVTPYILGGVDQRAQLNSAQNAYGTESETQAEAGFDLKYNLTPNLTLDVTYNTDFAQVEVDAQQVNLSRVSLFFPEKRLFFQERSSVFEFTTGFRDRVFYSRRIGLHQGRPVPILGGARLVGRSGNWDLGLLTMQTESTDALPSENFGVMRVLRQGQNARSYTGAILTTRVDTEGQLRATYGVDTRLGLASDVDVTAKWAQVLGSDQSPTWDSGLWMLSVARPRDTGLGFRTHMARAGSEYNPSLGYLSRKNVTDLMQHLSYGWRFPAASAWRTVGVSGRAYTAVRNDDLSRETGEIELQVEAGRASGWGFGGGFRWMEEDLRRAFSMAPGVEVPMGRYHFGGIGGGVISPRHNPLSVNLEGGLGAFYDGYRVGMGVRPRWSASKHLEVSSSYDYNWITFPERDQTMVSHLVGLQAQVMWSQRWSAASFVQYNHLNNTVASNLRVRYNPREGRDLFLVYNHGLDTERAGSFPREPWLREQTLVVKYSHTLTW